MADLTRRGPRGSAPAREPSEQHHDLYGPMYYASSLCQTEGGGGDVGAVPYKWGEPFWERFFGHLVGEVVTRLHPKTVLDAGCAIGFVVSGLRYRGVDAEGFDTSAWAISQVPEDAQPFCWVGSVTDELLRDYDLVTCIEVLEHVSPGEASTAVANFCRHGRAVLFSSTPEHFDEVTHINVRPPEYWAGLFARHGFYRDFDFDATFVSPHAVLFRPEQNWESVIRRYERWNWDSQRELRGVRGHRDRLLSEATNARNELEAIMMTKTFRLTARVRSVWAAAHRLRKQTRQETSTAADSDTLAET